jgi:transcription elongation factor Elf1
MKECPSFGILFVVDMSKIYTQGQIIAFIEKVFGKGKSYNSGLNYAVTCPICKHYKGSHYDKKKLSVKTTSPNILHCWVCGYKAPNLYRIIAKFFPEYIEEYKEKFLDSQSIRQDEQETEALDKVVSYPDSFTFLPEAYPNKYTRMMYEYLEKRGIAEKEIWQYKLGITGYDNKDLWNRIIIPSFDGNGVLNFWTSRSVNPKVHSAVKYVNCEVHREKAIYNEYFIDWKKPLVVVEGPFDIFKTTGNAVALLGSGISSKFKLFHRILAHKTPLILALDNDATSKSLELAKMFSEFHIDVKMFSIPSRYKDIGDMTKEEFSEQISIAPAFDDEFYLRQKIKGLR